MPPRLYRRRQVREQDSLTTLTEDRDDLQDEQEPRRPPTPPPKEGRYEPTIFNVHSEMTNLADSSAVLVKRPYPHPKASTSNRFKSAVGKLFGVRMLSKAKQEPPPRSPTSSAISSRNPSFYVPSHNVLTQRSAVTLLTSSSSTHLDDPMDEEGVTNLDLSRSPSPRMPPGSNLYYEPITTVLSRVQSSSAPRSVQRRTSQRTARTLPHNTPKQTPKRVPIPITPPLHSAPLPPPPVPITTLRRNRSTVPAYLPSRAAPTRSPTRILQPPRPSAAAPPDPKNHVFTGPWFNSRGDEWLGLGSTAGEYRVRHGTANPSNPRFMGYPETPDHFMNAQGDIMDAKTLQMVYKAPRR